VIDRRELNPTPKNSETTVSHHELS
jgi:hypothetical protein